MFPEIPENDSRPRSFSVSIPCTLQFHRYSFHLTFVVWCLVPALKDQSLTHIRDGSGANTARVTNLRNLNRGERVERGQRAGERIGGRERKRDGERERERNTGKRIGGGGGDSSKCR